MSGSYISADDFLTGVLGQAADFEVSGVGTVQVRSLTFAEVRSINQAHKGDEEGIALAAVVTGLVQPALSAEQAARLEQARPGVVAELSQRIMQLSGMMDDLPAKQAEDLGN